MVFLPLASAEHLFFLWNIFLTNSIAILHRSHQLRFDRIFLQPSAIPQAYLRVKLVDLSGIYFGINLGTLPGADLRCVSLQTHTHPSAHNTFFDPSDHRILLAEDRTKNERLPSRNTVMLHFNRTHTHPRLSALPRWLPSHSPPCN